MDKEIQCPCCENYIGLDNFEFTDEPKKQWKQMKKRIERLKKPIRAMVKELEA